MALPILAPILALGFVGTFFKFLYKYLPAVVVSIMTFLGISAVTYTGVSLLLGGFEDMILGAYNDLPTKLIFILKALNVDKVITMFISFALFKASIGSIKGFKNQYQVKHGGAPQ